MELRDTILYQKLEFLARTDPVARALLVSVEGVFSESVQLAKTLVAVLPEYTLHDEAHLLAVVDIMGRLLPEELLERLTPLEIGAAILAAGMHDLGMTASRDEINRLIDAPTTNVPSPVQLEFLQFRNTKPSLVQRREFLRRTERHAEMREVDAFLIAEYLRISHGRRIRRVIHDGFAGRLVYSGFPFWVQLVAVCESHTNDVDTLERIACDELVRAPGEYCNWRFVAVLLRLADILDFDPKRTPEILFRHLGIRNEVSVREWKKHQQIKAWDIAPTRIAFAAETTDPVIQSTILTFVGWINSELRNARSTIQGMYSNRANNLRDLYDLQLPADVDVSQVRPARGLDGPLYTYVDLRFRLETESIMHILMGLALYGERRLFLRELLQNAVDTCRHRMRVDQNYVPHVIVRLCKEPEGTVLSVEDNGMGMNSRIVENYFARIGKSYYRSPEFDQSVALRRFQPISQFGIGVLSVFMAGRHLTVHTRYFGEQQALQVEIADEGSLFWLRPAVRENTGTTLSVSLDVDLNELFPQADNKELQERGIDAQADISRLVGAVTSLVSHLEFPITCEAENIRYEVLSQPFKVDEFWGGEPFGLMMFRVDLSVEAPDGIDGILEFAIPHLNGGLEAWVLGHGAVLNSNGRPELDWSGVYSEWYEVAYGGIYKTYYNRSASGGFQGKTDLSLTTYGRAGQLGFNIPVTVINPRGGPYAVRLPFATRYDIELSGEFLLPLTADRTRIQPTEGAKQTCLRISTLLTRIMLERCRELIKSQPEYFENVVSLRADDLGFMYKAELHRVLTSNNG